MAAFRRPFASVGNAGQITFNPGECANQGSGFCEWNAEPRTPPPDGPRITNGSGAPPPPPRPSRPRRASLPPRRGRACPPPSRPARPRSTETLGALLDRCAARSPGAAFPARFTLPVPVVRVHTGRDIGGVRQRGLLRELVSLLELLLDAFLEFLDAGAVHDALARQQFLEPFHRIFFLHVVLEHLFRDVLGG